MRVAHGIIVFPGGVGTLEEILYLLGLLLHPDNQQQPLPLIFTGVKRGADAKTPDICLLGNAPVLVNGLEVTTQVAYALPIPLPYQCINLEIIFLAHGVITII